MMEPHELSPWGSMKIPSYAKASEGYPPLAKSAEATSFNTSRGEAQVTHSSTGRARGLLRRRIKNRHSKSWRAVCPVPVALANTILAKQLFFIPPPVFTPRNGRSPLTLSSLSQRHERRHTRSKHGELFEEAKTLRGLKVWRKSYPGRLSRAF